LRAVERKGLLQPVFDTHADIVCLQEIKSEAHQLPEAITNRNGYHAYFNSSKARKGYSGVALFSKEEPIEVLYDLGIPELDQEGRVITAIFKDFAVVNCYFPNGGGGPHRLEYKLRFYDAFLVYVEALRKKYTNVIFCGDVNTAHHAIDLARPKENEKNTGFLPEERAWLDEVEAHGWIDIYRHHNPNRADAYTYWDMKTRARERNVGWRIDYFFITPSLLKHNPSTTILADVYGSDHCPVELAFNK
jgi:exodeoxyribonuclease-3